MTVTRYNVLFFCWIYIVSRLKIVLGIKAEWMVCRFQCLIIDNEGLLSWQALHCFSASSLIFLKFWIWKFFLKILSISKSEEWTLFRWSSNKVFFYKDWRNDQFQSFIRLIGKRMCFLWSSLIVSEILLFGLTGNLYFRPHHCCLETMWRTWQVPCSFSHQNNLKITHY